MDQLKNAPQEAKLHFLDYWRIIRIRKTVILAVFLLVVITATVVTLMYPESYGSTTRITVEQEHPDISGVDQGAFGNGYDPYFLQTEFNVIQSHEVLSKVSEKMNLRDAWGKKYNGGSPLSETDVEGMVKRSLELQPVRNTKLIEIRAYSDIGADDAKSLADQVAQSYRDYRLQQYQDLKNTGINSLKQQLAEQYQKVIAAQAKVDMLRSNLNISDPNPDSTGPSQSLASKTVDELKSEEINRQAEYDQQSTLLTKLKSLHPDDLKKALPIAVSDTQLNSLLSELDLAQQSMLKVKAEYGLEHPKYQVAKESVADLEQKVNDRVDGILVGLQAKVDSAKAGMDSIKNSIEEARQKDIEVAQLSAPYYEAKEDLDREKKWYDVLKMKTGQEVVDRDLPKARMVTIIDPAVREEKPVRPNKPLNIILGVVFGLVVGIGLAFFIEYLDTSVKTIDDVERTLQAPVLGVIPQNIGLILEEGAESPHAEAYRVLRTNILFSRKDDILNTVVVVSAGAGEGKSTTAFNLATIFAQNGSRVLVVDSDLRRPTLHKMVNVTNSIGLTNYLLKQNTLDEVIQTTKVPTLHLMASGKLPSSSLGILSSAQMKELISELKQRYDFVFFDSPPIMGVSDASILASEVDMTLQVIQYRRYPQPMNIRAKQMIEKVGGNLVGIVLNNINMSQDESYYYYSGYYHDYYYAKNNDDKTPGADGGERSGGTDIKPKY
jgi:polysaccharide biosynthesis transport protein